MCFFVPSSRPSPTGEGEGSAALTLPRDEQSSYALRGINLLLQMPCAGKSPKLSSFLKQRFFPLSPRRAGEGRGEGALDLYSISLMCFLCPHPDLLPQGEGESSDALGLVRITNVF